VTIVNVYCIFKLYYKLDNRRLPRFIMILNLFYHEASLPQAINNHQKC
jgi:hypothetical protein